MKRVFILTALFLLMLMLSGCNSGTSSISATPTPTPTPTATPTPTPTLSPTPTPTPAPVQKQQNTQQSYNTGNTASGNTYTNGYVTTNTLSLEKYNKLQNGMSYEQVANILGSKGNLVSSSDIAGITTLSYGWYSQYGVPMVCVVFQNGKAASMYQIGLN